MALAVESALFLYKIFTHGLVTISWSPWARVAPLFDPLMGEEESRQASHIVATDYSEDRATTMVQLSGSLQSKTEI
jgi:hypothetical protein